MDILCCMALLHTDQYNVHVYAAPWYAAAGPALWYYPVPLNVRPRDKLDHAHVT